MSRQLTSERRHRQLALLLAAALWSFCRICLLAAGSASFRPEDLRCEYLNDPVGIEVLQPRLSWVLEPVKHASRGQFQTSWQILVASSEALLSNDTGDLWDSGRVSSEQSIQVAYAGRPLRPLQQCFWKVRAWDKDGRTLNWSPTARWSMGLLKPDDWHGAWVGLDGVEPESKVTSTSWIWFPEGHPEKEAPVATRYFRRSFELPAGRSLKSARWLVAGDDQFTAFVNGTRVGSGASFKSVSSFDVRGLLHPGRNILAAAVENKGEHPSPAGFLSLLEIQFQEGASLLLPTDETWQSSAEEFTGWFNPAYDDSTWLPARKLGPVGMEPWGDVAGPEDRRLPARWLRKEFSVERKVRRATACISGLGLSELYLNGKKIGDAVLSPGLTEYPQRVYYVTHDLTRQLRRGHNALGVVLGNGRFFAPRGKVPTETRSFGFPKLLFEMRIEYEDGSTATVVSDSTWKITDRGPIRANNEYDGEEYDARMEMPGWNLAGFDDSNWLPARFVSAPRGQLASEMTPPLRVMDTLKPVSMTQPRPGVFIFDLGQNMVGWCRLHVSGPRGATVSLRHAETLKPDGTLYLDNLRSARVTDTYILSGKGTEIYEPRFTYHGFRYVEVTGFPGRPNMSTIEGRVVHDALETVGDFACSDALLNRIYQNIRWGVRGNYRSIPTDCPQRDERQGWLGDRSAESKGETYLFHTATLYTKWVQDMADAQRASGSVSDVCPAYWPLYSDNVTWPSSTVIIPEALREQYADETVIRSHYGSAKRWMNYIERFVTNGIIARDSYGDWCVPPEDPKLIHSRDPARKTAPALLGTAYFFYDATLMAREAQRLENTDDARHFTELAQNLRDAFNHKFFNEDTGQYDNGSQTSCVLPLAFGLVPEAQRTRVFQHLLAKIRDESQGHIGTGLIGGQWLMRVLSDNGRADVAYSIATQRTYPSWGYMIEKGATTIWELWNGDTADPSMNSGNHVMLVGDLGIWLFEYLAGIKADREQPGFKHIIMRPEPVGDLKFVTAAHCSPFGWIVSDWKRDSAGFHWHIAVPANTSATVYVPTRDAESVTEGGHDAFGAPGVRFVGMQDGRAVFEVGSGDYKFQSK